MRETARELLENASPQEREAMERWALEKMRERPPAQDAAPRTPWRPDTETFDARPNEIPPDAAERVVARWFSDEGVDRSGATSRRETAEAVREAREGAERAIDQQVVPRRHADLVRRVFQRYAERTGAADAPDAGSTRP